MEILSMLFREVLNSKGQRGFPEAVLFSIFSPLLLALFNVWYIHKILVLIHPGWTCSCERSQVSRAHHAYPNLVCQVLSAMPFIRHSNKRHLMRYRPIKPLLSAGSLPLLSQETNVDTSPRDRPLQVSRRNCVVLRLVCTHPGQNHRVRFAPSHRSRS